MAKQWVDITTIDNSTPFMKVRWKWKFYGSQYDSWFAEAPGLVTDGKGWTNGNKDWGWYSAHRLNNGWGGNYVYCCSFDFDHTMSGYWDISGQNYGVSLKDGSRNQFYDTTVVINGETYYEVDFSLWSGASGYQLYAPYLNKPWHQGDIYVEIGSDPITVDKDYILFFSTGGTVNIEVTADNAWTAMTSEAWVSLSQTGGTSGITTLSVTAPNYTSTTEDRTASITLTDGSYSVVINVKQNRVSQGLQNVYLGDVPITNIYLGDVPITNLFIGDNPIF